MENIYPIRVEKLRKDYRVANKSVTVLSNINISVQEEEIISILGPSGCGKTTLIKLIAGLIPPTLGNVFIYDLIPPEAAKKRLLTYVSQEPALLPWRTVRQNVGLPNEIGSGRGKNSTASALSEEDALLIVGLSQFTDAYANQLSGGMKSRVALARALVCGSKILLMDEPFGNLDEMLRESLNKMLLEIIRQYHLTVLLITHSLREAVFLSDRILIFPNKHASNLHEYRSVVQKKDNAHAFDTDEFVRELRRLKQVVEVNHWPT